VVVSDIAALREVAGPHAVAAAATDPEAIAGAIERALAGPDDDATRAARRARAREFSWAACADRTLDAYLAP
jgi:glycosyltransferase involved in cell wall biosynthesis